MAKVRFIVTDESESWHFEKEFEVSVVPQKGWLVQVDGAVITVKDHHVLQVSGNFVQVYCSASLLMLCVLHSEQQGWAIHEGVDVFVTNTKVRREVKRLEEMRRQATGR